MVKITCSEKILQKFRFYEDFWKGDGPFPILFAKPHLAKDRNYLKYDLVEQHQDVHKLLAESLLAVEPHLDLIDDGIPTVRSDLGTTLLPSGLGLDIVVQPEQHPWLQGHLTPDQIRQLPDPLDIHHIKHNEILLAEQFYHLLLQGQQAHTISSDIFPYVPDTQGIFDLSHLLVGNDLFLLLQDDPDLVDHLQKKSLELFLAGTWFFKHLLGETASSMVHGHGMHSGVWFPDTGARMSEDSCTLISGRMIKKFCLPYIKKGIAPFGRGFMHYCGKHSAFLQMVCEMEEISTLNLGNPELYDLDELFSLAGRTHTVYFGHFDVFEGEDGFSYLERLADYCGRHGAKLILVSGYQLGDQEEKQQLVERWHVLTRSIKSQ